MNGPEHYRRAEKFLSLAETEAQNGRDGKDWSAIAQVHATLALVAATAVGELLTRDPDTGELLTRDPDTGELLTRDGAAWREATK